MATFAAERLQMVHLSSGDLLREAVRQQNAVGRQARRFMERGTLVPDRLVVRFILERLQGLGSDRPVVLDGFPRTVEQAVRLDEMLTEEGHRPIDLAIDFEISEETVVKRLVGRKVCSRCGANYHVVTLPPRESDLCDRCGASLSARADDELQTIRKRLKSYREETSGLLEFYRSQGKLRLLSGEPAIEEQYQSLVRLLQEERLA